MSQDHSSWKLVVAVHRDDEVLQSTLLKSPIANQPGRLILQRGFRTVAQAYRQAVANSEAELFVFAHPDVYFPPEWEYSFTRSLKWLERSDPNWGVAGLYGVSSAGTGHGFLYSTGRRGFVGFPFPLPTEVRTLDEFVFAIRRESSLDIPLDLPNDQFQLGTTDLCLQANRLGLRNYSLPCFVIHNANRWNSLPLRFLHCYLHLRRKWWEQLPVIAPYAAITRHPITMLRMASLHLKYSINNRARETTRVADPESVYTRLRNDILMTLAPALQNSDPAPRP